MPLTGIAVVVEVNSQNRELMIDRSRGLTSLGVLANVNQLKMTAADARNA